MTDFLSWWADHWPLIPIVVALFVWFNLQFYWLGKGLQRDFGSIAWTLTGIKIVPDERRREP